VRGEGCPEIDKKSIHLEESAKSENPQRRGRREERREKRGKKIRYSLPWGEMGCMNKI